MLHAQIEVELLDHIAHEVAAWVRPYLFKQSKQRHIDKKSRSTGNLIYSCSRQTSYMLGEMVNSHQNMSITILVEVSYC